MSNILSFEFEEMPIAIVNGIEAGLINGMIDIKYDRDGNWEVYSISIEGHQKLTTEERKAGKKPWIYVTAPPAVAELIYDRFRSGWFDQKVYDAVQEQLSSDREDAAEMRAEMRRDARMGL